MFVNAPHLSFSQTLRILNYRNFCMAQLTNELGSLYLLHDMRGRRKCTPIKHWEPFLFFFLTFWYRCIQIQPNLISRIMLVAANRSRFSAWKTLTHTYTDIHIIYLYKSNMYISLLLYYTKTVVNILGDELSQFCVLSVDLCTGTILTFNGFVIFDTSFDDPPPAPPAHSNEDEWCFWKSQFCVFDNKTGCCRWLFANFGLSASLIISSISALAALDIGRTTLTRLGRSAMLPAIGRGTMSSFRGFAYLRKFSSFCRLFDFSSSQLRMSHECREGEDKFVLPGWWAQRKQYRMSKAVPTISIPTSMCINVK